MRRRRHAMITPQAATTSDALLEALLDARRVELALLDDLTDAQMLGERAHFLEPPIWEMGHVGWFQEYWLLRRLDGADPLLPGRTTSTTRSTSPTRGAGSIASRRAHRRAPTSPRCCVGAWPASS